MKIFVTMLIVLFLIHFASGGDMYANERRAAAKTFTDHLDVKGFFADDKWWVHTVFFDLNADGIEEGLLASTMDSFQTGCSWRGAIKTNDNKWKIVYPDVYCRLGNFFYYESIQDVPKLLAKDVGYFEKSEKDRAPEEDLTAWKCGDVSFLSDKDSINYNIIKEDISFLFTKGDFRKLTSIKTGKFTNLDCKGGSAGSPPIEMKSYKDQQETSPLIKSFMDIYREQIKKEKSLTQKINVYAIPVDVNNDGKEDVFISSDVEKKGNNQFVWHLYLNKDGNFSPLKERLFMKTRMFTEIIDPEEIATRDSFYKVKLNDDPEISEALVIYDFKDKKLVSHSYQKLLTEEERQKRPEYFINGLYERDKWLEFEDWKGAIEYRLTYPPPFTFRELIGNMYFQSIERLQCFEDLK